MASLLVICFILLSLIIPLLYFKFRYPYVKQMNLIPGPKGHPLFGVMYETLYTPENKRMATFNNYFKTHGSLFRTWIGAKCIVHIANAEHAQIILSSLAHINKSKMYSFFQPWLGSGMFLSGGEKWSKRRKIFAPAFHFSLMKDYVKIMATNGQIFMDRMEEKAGGSSFDIYPYFAECSLDIIGETALGVHLNVQKGLLSEFIKNIHKFTRLLADRIQKPFLEWHFVHRFTANYKEQLNSVDALRKISTQIIKQRISDREARNANVKVTKKEGCIKKKAFLDAMLDAWEEGDKGVNFNDIREELDGFIFAAYDSTSTSIAWTCYLVGSHPEVQEQIHSEIDAVLKSNGGQIDMNSISQLRYLECVYKESLRLYPPGPIVGRNLGEDIKLGNYEIPAGTNVLIHLQLIQRSPEYYLNPDQFDPLRKHTNPHAFIPFISGPRSCMGQKFAILQAMIVLTMFFQRYEVESVTKLEDMTTVWNLIWRSEHGIQVKIRHRK